MTSGLLGVWKLLDSLSAINFSFIGMQIDMPGFVKVEHSRLITSHQCELRLHFTGQSQSHEEFSFLPPHLTNVLIFSSPTEGILNQSHQLKINLFFENERGPSAIMSGGKGIHVPSTVWSHGN